MPRSPVAHDESHRGPVRALLEGLIDYAGLFPPAGLPMTETVINYAAYQRRPDAWALGRLVVPAGRLEEFEVALADLSDAERLGTRWPLTALVGPDWQSSMTLVRQFNERHVHGGPQVQAVEGRTTSVADIHALARAADTGYERYCELPLEGPLDDLVIAVRDAGARAKVRAGGVTAAEFPAPELLLEFLRVCALARVPFKATAGLHHLLRGPAPLTYSADSATATMYGYLNLLLAAAVFWAGRPEAEARRLLVAMDAEGLDLHGDRLVRLSGVALSVDEIRRARQEFVLAIGSCSFTEPLSEIQP
jgi:hypothetical protein